MSPARAKAAPQDRGPRPSAFWTLAVLGVAAFVLAIWVRLPGWAGFLLGGAVAAAAALGAAARARAARDELARLRDEQAADALRTRALESHAQQLRELLNAVSEPVVAADAGGNVMFCNRAASDLLSVAAERLIGRPVSDVFTQAEIVRMHAAAHRGAPGHQQVRFSGPDGPRTLNVSAVPLAHPGAENHGAEPPAHPVVLTLHDVTELDLAVQVKSDFVANASHELRTPVAAIKAAVETLTGGAMHDAPMRNRLVDIIAANTERLSEMIRDLLDISRLESPNTIAQLAPVNPADLIAILAPMFEGVCAERSLSLRFEFDPEIGAMESDRNLLLLILKNLIENSTRFAYEGTEILVTGRPLPAVAVQPHRSTAPGTRRGVRFEVIDRGAGIPLAHQVRIFERYYQVDSARTGTAPRRGTGLGLSIVKHAVRNLGGIVRVSSVWKQGTTMTVDLPNCLPPARANPTKAEPPAAAPGPQSNGR